MALENSGRRNLLRLRLLPVVIVLAGVALTARIGDLWHGLGGAAQAQTSAGSAPAKPKNGKPDQTDQAKDTAPSSDSVTGTAEKSAKDDSDSQIADLPPDPLSMTDEDINLLQALAQRRAALDGREKQVGQREALLKAAEGRIDEKVKGLKALQAMIEGQLIKHDEQTENQYRSLVKIYENMKPKDAARIFEQLDMVVLLEVIERMKERKTAPILAKMNPDRAKSITIELAQRRQLPVAKE